jgi:heme exporter protein A
VSGCGGAGPGAVEARGLERRFGPVAVLREIDLRIGTGEHVAVVGPNGAGKTTLLKMVAGLLRPTAGSLRVFGRDVLASGSAVRRSVGFAGHQSYLYDDLTVEENLELYGRLYGLRELGRRIERGLGACGLWGRRTDRVRTLSRGLHQRAAIARALLHDPPLLLLDEPDTGLDPAGLCWLEEVAADPRRTVVISTHALQHARRWCERAVVLVGGRVAFDGPAARLEDPLPPGVTRPAAAGALQDGAPGWPA